MVQKIEAETSLARQDNIKSEEYDLLSEAGFEFGFKIPKEGTVAYKRLKSTAGDYMEAVIYQATSPLIAVDIIRAKSSDERRRKFHNNLCLLLLGKSREELSYKDRDRVSDFAARATNHDDFVGTF